MRKIICQHFLIIFHWLPFLHFFSSFLIFFLYAAHFFKNPSSILFIIPFPHQSVPPPLSLSLTFSSIFLHLDDSLYNSYAHSFSLLFSSCAVKVYFRSLESYPLSWMLVIPSLPRIRRD